MLATLSTVLNVNVADVGPLKRPVFDIQQARTEPWSCGTVLLGLFADVFRALEREAAVAAWHEIHSAAVVCAFRTSR